jgi:DNA-binding transcriptional regulator of glucitol operon
VSRAVRKVLRPGWVLGDLIVLAMVVTMILLGRWQLEVSNRKHFDIQNFGYALQWWAFSVFAVWMWVRVLRDAMQRAVEETEPASQRAEAAAAAAEPVAYRRYVIPNSADVPAPSDDAEHAAYNDYLARLGDRTDEGTPR